MYKSVLTIALALTASAAGAVVPGVAVPEIDAVSGLAAVAAIGGVVTLMWERSRR
jgi:hypothetical protein